MCDKHNYEDGISLVSVLIAAALTAGISLTLMRLSTNSTNMMISNSSKTDENELIISIRNIVNNDKHCKVSLAGDSTTGPITFFKKDHNDNSPRSTEGLDVSLYLANQNGELRSIKKFNGSNNIGTSDKSQFGKVRLKSMKLFFGPSSMNSNYSKNVNHNEVAILQVKYERQISNIRKREITKNVDVGLNLSTDENGETTIISCSYNSLNNSSSDEKRWFLYSNPSLYTSDTAFSTHLWTNGTQASRVKDIKLFRVPLPDNFFNISLKIIGTGYMGGHHKRSRSCQDNNPPKLIRIGIGRNSKDGYDCHWASGKIESIGSINIKSPKMERGDLSITMRTEHNGWSSLNQDDSTPEIIRGNTTLTLALGNSPTLVASWGTNKGKGQVYYQLIKKGNYIVLRMKVVAVNGGHQNNNSIISWKTKAKTQVQTRKEW